ncbi:hypothetical protein [Pseudorhodoplanes sp.]|uniref:hypothetical protein n=1 Tax=Pseudorhodoplanes sp. TaxID=1934341 RepID=UPI003D116AA0
MAVDKLEIIPSSTPLKTLLRLETSRILTARHALALIATSLMGVALAFWLPQFPESVHRFFERIFQLPDWPEIVVANDLTGLFFFVYWVGSFDILAIYVVPLEERYLDLYLSKPLSRRDYMLARIIPIVIIVLGLGVLSAIAHWLALIAAGLKFPLLVYFGAAAAVLGWTVCLLAIVNLAILAVRDTYSALVVAFIPLLASILPGVIYMYRPDVFEGAPMLRATAVFPNTLVWHPEFSARWGAIIAIALCGAGVMLIGAAARQIERRDIA